MHYFGSKQELFQRVTHDRPVPELTGTADHVTEQILARRAASAPAVTYRAVADVKGLHRLGAAGHTVRLPDRDGTPGQLL